MRIVTSLSSGSFLEFGSDGLGEARRGTEVWREMGSMARGGPWSSVSCRASFCLMRAWGDQENATISQLGTQQKTDDTHSHCVV